MATIGQVLLTPESGWIRYDSQDALITYIGTWTVQNYVGPYNGTSKYCNSAGNKIRFNFTGKKIRLIAYSRKDQYGVDTPVYIDGNLCGTFSQRVTDSATEQVLVYEKCDLSDGEHYFEINTIGTLYVSIDAIDIADTGTLKTYLNFRLKSSLTDMQIGDYISCKYTATSGVVGTFSELGTTVASEIPVASTATPNGSFNFVKVDKGLAIADRCVQHSISWDVLNAGSLIEGKSWNNGDIIPNMTSNILPNGVASAGTNYVGYYPWQAFNGTLSDINDCWITNNTVSDWLKFDFGTTKMILQYNLTARNATAINTAPKDWTFEGSNDDTNWTVLHTVINQTSWTNSQKRTFPISNTQQFRYYRINISSNNGGASIAIGELEMIDTATIIRSLSGGNSYANDTQQYLPTKLANPATLPTGTGRAVAYSPDGNLLAVGMDASPYFHVYSRTNDVYTKLADPAIIPTNIVYALSFSPDGKQLAVGMCSAPFLRIYNVVNNVLTTSFLPTDLPANQANAISYTKDGKMMAVAHHTTPFITIYTISNGIYTKIANPATLPAGTAFGCDFSPDGNQLTVVTSISTYICTYNINRSTNVFTKIIDPVSLPASYPNGCTYSPDGSHIAISCTASPYIYFYKVASTQYKLISQPTVIPTGAPFFKPVYSPDGKYVCISHATSPFLSVYRRNGDVYSKIANSTTLPTGTGYGCAFSPDSSHLAIAHGTSPYVTIYKTAFNLPPNYISQTTNAGFGAYPPDNEWDKYIVSSDLAGKISAGDNAVWNIGLNTDKPYNWCRETPVVASYANTNRVGRGRVGVNYWYPALSTATADRGFRPVLIWREADSPATNLFS